MGEVGCPLMLFSSATVFITDVIFNILRYVTNNWQRVGGTAVVKEIMYIWGVVVLWWVQQCNVNKNIDARSWHPEWSKKRPKIRENAIFSGDIWLNWIRWVMIYNISYTTQLHFLPTECFARLIWCWWWNRKGGEILCKYFRKCKAGKAREGASLCCPVVWRVQQ